MLDRYVRFYGQTLPNFHLLTRNFQLNNSAQTIDLHKILVAI